MKGAFRLFLRAAVALAACFNLSGSIFAFAGDACQEDEGLRRLLARTLQNCPGNGLEIVIPSQPNGNTDTWGRKLQFYLENRLSLRGLPINKAGGSQTIGTLDVMRTRPGLASCRILVAQNNTVGWNHLIFKDLPRPLDNLAPIALVGDSPLILVASRGSGIHTYEQFRLLVSGLQERKDSLTYGTNGRLGVEDLAMIELLRSMGVTGATAVPFRGSSDVTMGIVSSTILVAMQTPLSVATYLGKEIIPLGLTKPLSGFDLPVIEEGAYGSDAVKSMWIGYLGPKQMRADLVQALNKVANCMIQDAEIGPKLRGLFYNLIGGGPEVLQEAMSIEDSKWRNTLPLLVEQAGGI